MKSKIYCGWEVLAFAFIGACMGFMGGLVAALL